MEYAITQRGHKSNNVDLSTEKKEQREQGTRTITTKQHQVAPKKVPKNLKWVHGTSQDGRGEVVVTFKENKRPEDRSIFRFSYDFNLVAGGHTLNSGDILCNFDYHKGQFFVLTKQGDGESRPTYKATDGEDFPSCACSKKPKGLVNKYGIAFEPDSRTKWPVKKLKIEFDTCFINGDRDANWKQKLQMKCKESSRLPQFSITVNGVEI